MEYYLETVSNQKQAIERFRSMVGINSGLETYMKQYQTWKDNQVIGEKNTRGW